MWTQHFINWYDDRNEVVMESSLARLGSGSSRIFLLLLEKLEPKNRLSLIGSTEKNSGLKSLIFHDLQSAF
jgi:hypothetical protein